MQNKAKGGITMYDVKVSNGSVFYITEEEKLRVLKRRMELERKRNSRFKRVWKETWKQKLLALLVTIMALAASVYTQDSGILVVILFSCFHRKAETVNKFGYLVIKIVSAEYESVFKFFKHILRVIYVTV
jgi:hypothetical protein